jgi:hypothetical protein
MYRKSDFSPKIRIAGPSLPSNTYKSIVYHVLYNVMCGCGNKRFIIIIIIIIILERSYFTGLASQI